MATKLFKPTFLYVKQHKKTGLLYFGKTTRLKIVENYSGSGRYWNRHLEKHGRKYVETLWYCLFTEKDELVNFATMCSAQWDVVNAKNKNGKKLWANEKPENGLDGGFKEGFGNGGLRSEKTKQKTSNTLKGVNTWTKGRKWSEEERTNRPDTSGENNHFYGKTHNKTALKKMADEWQITTPDSKILIVTNLQQFCKQNNLNPGAMGDISRGKRRIHKGYTCVNLTKKRATK